MIQTKLPKWIKRENAPMRIVVKKSIVDIGGELDETRKIRIKVEFGKGDNKSDIVANNGWNECGTLSCTHLINVAIVKAKHEQGIELRKI